MPNCRRFAGTMNEVANGNAEELRETMGRWESMGRWEGAINSRWKDHSKGMFKWRGGPGDGEMGSSRSRAETRGKGTNSRDEAPRCIWDTKCIVAWLFFCCRFIGLETFQSLVKRMHDANVMGWTPRQIMGSEGNLKSASAMNLAIDREWWWLSCGFNGVPYEIIYVLSNHVKPKCVLFGMCWSVAFCHCSLQSHWSSSGCMASSENHGVLHHHPVDVYGDKMGITPKEWE